jgi:hypothetical protein
MSEGENPQVEAIKLAGIFIRIQKSHRLSDLNMYASIPTNLMVAHWEPQLQPQKTTSPIFF